MKANLILTIAATLLAAACSCSSNAPTPMHSTSITLGADFDHTHSDFTVVLAQVVNGEQVDYTTLKGIAQQLDHYLAQLEATDPADFASWTREQRYAFWINAYNAYILRLIRDADNPASIRDLGGAVFGRIWDLKLIPLGKLAPALEQDLLSFGNIEHDILRPQFKDARTHAAINCASESCPPLQAFAFNADGLEIQLEETMVKFLGNSRLNKFDREAKTLEVSSIFDWFGEDFERDEGDIRAYVQRYLGEGNAWISGADLSFLEYSWSLNAVD